ncbi:MAG TPA: DUF2269 domain-containing protein [Burkholderiaceae bacterium]|jgi:uncharacterized membrane protein|nr:DUF2269 domain-containing protein [Burkholderiaceae bacterium]
MTYTDAKTLHVLSMVLLFGTGLGSAYYKWMADRTRQVPHIAATSRHVVLADWLFTTPTVLIQPATGLWMAHLAGLPLSTPWLAASLVLYAVAGLCWLPVVVLQIRMHALARRAADIGQALPPAYWRMARAWFWLGVPAFSAMVLVVVLMVGKRLPGVGS